MLGLNYGFGHRFGNSEAYYGPWGLYADPGPSADPAHRLGRDKVGIRA